MGHGYIPECTGPEAASRRHDVLSGRRPQRHEDRNAHVAVCRQVQRILSARSSVCRVLVSRVCGHWLLRNKVRGAHNTLHCSHAALPSATQRNRISNKKNEELMMEHKQRKDGTTAARAAEQARLSNERQSRRNSQLARCCGPGLQHRTNHRKEINQPSHIDRIVSLRHCAEFLSSILQ